MHESISGSFVGGGGEIIDTQRCFLHISLSLHSVPSAVIQREARLHSYIQWPIPHIEGEDNLRRS